MVRQLPTQEALLDWLKAVLTDDSQVCIYSVQHEQGELAGYTIFIDVTLLGPNTVERVILSDGNGPGTDVTK